MIPMALWHIGNWMMGEGNVIKDYTSNGNDLTGYVFDGSQWNNYHGEEHWSPGMEWVRSRLTE